MEKYTILNTLNKGGSNLGIYLLFHRDQKQKYIGKHGVTQSQVRATQKLYALSPECCVRVEETFLYQGYLMMVTEHMTGSVGDYVRNTERFSDVEFELIMKNVYACWLHLGKRVGYAGADFKLDNIVYDEKTLSVKFIDIDEISFNQKVDMVESAVGFGILEVSLYKEFKRDPEYSKRVASIILGVVEIAYQSDALLFNLGLKSIYIQCNAVKGCINMACVMCGETCKVFYCSQHQPY